MDIEYLPPDGGREELCGWCGEQVKMGEGTTRRNGDEPFHSVCMIRAVMGSVGHLMGRTDGDPPGMSKYEAAKAAAALFKAGRGARGASSTPRLRVTCIVIIPS